MKNVFFQIISVKLFRDDDDDDFEWMEEDEWFSGVNMRKWRVPFSEGMWHGGHVTTRFDTWFRTPGGPPSVTHHIVKRRYRDKRPRGGWCTPRRVVFPQPPYHAHLWTLQTCFNFFDKWKVCRSKWNEISLSISLTLFYLEWNWCKNFKKNREESNSK